MKYDYFSEMFEDITDVVRESYYTNKMLEYVETDDNGENDIDYDGISEMLNAKLWTNDAVTGNASGSYFFNSELAKNAVTGNEDLLKDALFNFGYNNDEIVEHIFNGDWEYFDVTVRCYILSDVIADVIKTWLPNYLSEIIVGSKQEDIAEIETTGDNDDEQECGSINNWLSSINMAKERTKEGNSAENSARSLCVRILI